VRRNSTNNHEFQTVFKSQELTEQPLEQKSSSVLANTHIIRVSGPVTNLDDPAAASTTAFQPRERSSSEVRDPTSTSSRSSRILDCHAYSTASTSTTTSASSSPFSTSPTLQQHQQQQHQQQQQQQPTSKIVQTSV